MPTYLYKCKNCDFQFEDTFKIIDRNIPVENPQRYGTCNDEDKTPCELEIVPQMPSMVSMRDTWRKHTSDGWKDNLRRIKSNFPGSSIDV